MSGKKYILFILFFIYSVFSFFGESEGIKLFKINQPEKAAPVLEKEIEEGNISYDTFNYLGLSYFQTGNYEKAVDAFERGLKSTAASDKKQLCFNEGNVAYVTGDFSRAENSFSLALAVAPDFYPALLNRANTRLSNRNYNNALTDYKKYIEVLPDDPQAENIRKLISYLEEQLVFEEQEKVRLQEEQKRIEEENSRMQAELARQQAEKEAKEAEQRAIEAERRRKLLEDVANSLQQTETTNITAGAEDVLDYDYESELD